MKTFAFRFDIDTPTCLDEGVPRLLDLSERLGLRFSFFLCLGRSVSRLGVLSRSLQRTRRQEARAAGYSARKKLGFFRYVRLALLNPEIGRGASALVRRLSESADLGLHGGWNHDHWHHQAREWPRSRIEAELDWGVARLADLGVSVSGFCSPGWNAPDGLPELLHARGFSFRADRYGGDETGAVVEPPGVVNLATNILGEPGGVAYLEHMRARGLTDAGIRDAFRKRLREVGDYAVTYDHPYYAGLHALGLVEDLVRVAVDEGFEVITMAEMAEGLTPSGPS